MSAETIDLLVRLVFAILLSIITYVVVPAIKTWRNTKLSQEQRETLDYWVDTGVRWAKQWLQTSTGEEKKEKVMEFVLAKVAELGLPYTEEDIDKAIEAVYESIKGEPVASSQLIAGDVGVAGEGHIE